MVNSISYQLAKVGHRVTGFGSRRTCGRGIVRRTVGSIARPALTYIANKIADVISGNGMRTRRSLRGSSWKLTGSGRRPRRTLVTRKRRPTGAGYRKKRTTTTTRRAPRRRLGTGVRRTYRRRR